MADKDDIREGKDFGIGIPQKNTIELLPTSIGGEKINWIVLDDASDTTKAVTNAKKLVSEDKVDVIIGSSTTLLPGLVRLRRVCIYTGEAARNVGVATHVHRHLRIGAKGTRQRDRARR